MVSGVPQWVQFGLSAKFNLYKWLLSLLWPSLSLAIATSSFLILWCDQGHYRHSDLNFPRNVCDLSSCHCVCKDVVNFFLASEL